VSGAELALASLAVAVGALVQGSVGFGLNLIAAPLLALIDRDLVPGPALAAAFVLTILMTMRERRSVEWRGVGWAFAGRVPGTVLAAAAIASLPERGLGIFFALLVLLGVAISLLRWHPRPTPTTLLGAGALSGFMGTATSIGGPPMALVYQRLAGASLRGTLSGYFVLGSILSIATLAAVGEFGADQLRATAVLVPGVVAGFLLSRLTSGLIDDRGAARAAVLWVSALSAVALLLDALFSG
jgi:uncharacterized membrane protein YfcA